MQFTVLVVLWLASIVQGKERRVLAPFDSAFGQEDRELFAEDRSGPSSPSSDGGCPSISPVNPTSFKLNELPQTHYLVRTSQPQAICFE
jgi:hypothetical protein